MSEPTLETLGPGHARVFFPRDWPVFAGHLPGRPIVPGAELIRLAAEVRGLPLCGVDRFKFHAPIGPGETIDIRAGEDGRVEIRRGEVLCCAGRIR